MAITTRPEECRRSPIARRVGIPATCRLRLASLALMAACSVGATTGAFAQVTWTGASNGNWSGANWLNGSLSNEIGRAHV